ncbi:Type I restriction modification DNA specificity domain protein [compost metagenome]
MKSPAATNQGFQSLVVNEGFDVYFIYSAGGRIKDFALKNASGSTFLEISGKSLSKMEFVIPSLEEQIAIGNFFRHLDELLAAQTKKVEQLQQLKAAYLKKMFI